MKKEAWVSGVWRVGGGRWEGAQKGIPLAGQGRGQEWGFWSRATGSLWRAVSWGTVHGVLGFERLFLLSWGQPAGVQAEWASSGSRGETRDGTGRSCGCVGWTGWGMGRSEDGVPRLPLALFFKEGRDHWIPGQPTSRSGCTYKLSSVTGSTWVLSVLSWEKRKSKSENDRKLNFVQGRQSNASWNAVSVPANKFYSIMILVWPKGLFSSFIVVKLSYARVRFWCEFLLNKQLQSLWVWKHVLSAALRVASSPHLKLQVIWGNPITTPSPQPLPYQVRGFFWEVFPFPAGPYGGWAELSICTSRL